MELKTSLCKQFERENEHLLEQEIGSEEYCESMKRLMELEDKIADLEKFEDGRKDRIIKNVIEGVKVAGGIGLPIVGLVVITAFEKEETFTSSLKGFINCFIPKKLF